SSSSGISSAASADGGTASRPTSCPRRHKHARKRSLRWPAASTSSSSERGSSPAAISRSHATLRSEQSRPIRETPMHRSASAISSGPEPKARSPSWDAGSSCMPFARPTRRCKNRSMAKTSSKRRRYSTGSEDLDARVADLVATLDIPARDLELVNGIITTGLLFAGDSADRLDLKIVNAALKEMRYAFKVFAPYRAERKVSVFGSSRTRPGDPDYEQAREFGKLMAERGWMVVTGAGPGSMEAANEGAGAAHSFGVNIRLPFEAEPNPVIAEDPKLINFKYFFTRKLMFMKEASAFV